MASVPVVLRRIRRARRESSKARHTGRYEQYEPEYERIFEAAADCAGEDVLDDLGEWAMTWTEREQRLPTPARVRERARELCEGRGVEIPAESALTS